MRFANSLLGVAAAKLALEMGPDKRIVTLLCDSGKALSICSSGCVD